MKKKLLSAILATAMVASLLVGCGSQAAAPAAAPEAAATEEAAEETEDVAEPAEETAEATEAAGDYAVAMITDSGDITDQSFNQTTYESCVAFCEANGIDFNYYKPTDDSDEARIASTEQAIAEGYNVIVMPGYLFAATVAECAPTYPEVDFIVLDDSSAEGLDNVYEATYQEELPGYMAGYAAVKLGYKHLGFLGGMSVPAVIRYGFGYVQGANAAAEELGIADQVTVEYVYGGQFFGDADITAVMDTWYNEKGVEIVFGCGGGVYTSAAEIAQNCGGKLIGVDVDQAATIDSLYGDGITVTSAMKGLAATVNTLLTETVLNDNFSSFGGKVENLGIVSDDVDANYVALAPSTQWSSDFTEDDYKALVADMNAGKIKVDNNTEAMPTVAITVNDFGSIK
ncbi:MAG: BMP family ABC transporter substrate-binding protein [Lachnospiraceae bacterium]|nr:BMP family ABC transporter substrate-binding protein [Lachnospiraceae bacterium]